MMGDGKVWIFCQTGARQAPIVYFFITIHCQILQWIDTGLS
jgi:hypothetical protein